MSRRRGMPCIAALGEWPPQGLSSVQRSGWWRREWMARNLKRWAPRALCGCCGLTSLVAGTSILAALPRCSSDKQVLPAPCGLRRLKKQTDCETLGCLSAREPVCGAPGALVAGRGARHLATEGGGGRSIAPQGQYSFIIASRRAFHAKLPPAILYRCERARA